MALSRTHGAARFGIAWRRGATLERRRAAARQLLESSLRSQDAANKLGAAILQCPPFRLSAERPKAKHKEMTCRGPDLRACVLRPGATCQCRHSPNYTQLIRIPHAKPEQNRATYAGMEAWRSERPRGDNRHGAWEGSTAHASVARRFLGLRRSERTAVDWPPWHFSTELLRTSPHAPRPHVGASNGHGLAHAAGLLPARSCAWSD